MASGLEIRNLEVVYQGVIQALSDLSLTVPEGAVVALLGANGAGKTTTLKAISSFLPLEGGRVTRGSIKIGGKDMLKLAPHQIVRRGVFHVREGRHIFADMTVEENLIAATFAQRRARPRKEAFEEVHSYFPISPRAATSRRAISPAASSRCSPLAALWWRTRDDPARRAVARSGAADRQGDLRDHRAHQPRKEGFHPSGRAECGDRAEIRVLRRHRERPHRARALPPSLAPIRTSRSSPSASRVAARPDGRSNSQGANRVARPAARVHPFGRRCSSPGSKVRDVPISLTETAHDSA